MSNNPLIIFDFDGVIVDGINEYWMSSRQACINMLEGTDTSVSLPINVPKTFQTMRPWVHHGWEMVLLAAECSKINSYLNRLGIKNFCSNYPYSCKEALKEWSWDPITLQKALENARRTAIQSNFKYWLSCHKDFPGVINRLKKLEAEELDLTVLTTKSIEFTNKLLNAFRLKPSLVYGHESGSKIDVLKKIAKNRVIKAFIEDRRTTLETVQKDPELVFLPCYLASWGYLKPEDLNNLPPRIKLLEPSTFQAPIRNWP